MADLFPIGAMASGSNNGTIESVSYSMLEPNNGCNSNPIYNNLSTMFENQTRLTRKKAETFLTLSYKFDNIFTREYNQIEHFTDYVEEGLNSFFLVDWSHGLTPTSISTASPNWVVSISNTRLYSTVSNKKASYAICYNGSSWKLGSVSAISTNTSVTLNVDSNNYGAMSDAQANLVTTDSGTMLYPVYTVFMNRGTINNFRETVFIPNIDANLTADGGWMRSGELTFTSKYAV